MRKCEKIRKFAGEYMPPEKIENRKSRPGKSKGEYKYRPRKIRQGSKVRPAPPGKLGPQRPPPGHAAPGPGSPDRTPPDATRPAQERPALLALPSSAALPPAARTGPGSEISPEARKDAQRLTVAQISRAQAGHAPPSSARAGQEETPSGPRPRGDRPTSGPRKAHHAQSGPPGQTTTTSRKSSANAQRSGQGRRKQARKTYLL